MRHIAIAALVPAAATAAAFSPAFSRHVVNDTDGLPLLVWLVLFLGAARSSPSC